MMAVAGGRCWGDSLPTAGADRSRLNVWGKLTGTNGIFSVQPTRETSDLFRMRSSGTLLPNL
jgi:hypothetical protein